MTKSKKRINLIIWIALGIVTNIHYLLIFFILLTTPNATPEPGKAIEIIVSLVSLSIFLSLIVILKGYKEEKETKWGMILLAILQVPSLIGFGIALQMVLT